MRNASLRARSSGFLLTQKSDAKSKRFVKVPSGADVTIMDWQILKSVEGGVVEEKLTTLEEKEADALEMATQENEEREEKEKAQGISK